MEIKRTLDIMDEGKKIIMDNLGTIPIQSFSEYNMKKWIAQEELIKELDKTWNMINKYKMDRHPNYITKTQVAMFLRELRNTITSDSRSSDKDSLNKGYEVNQK
jgi:sulfur relay (sulfurtransferase) DsrC/TusE family protein